jgi:hypothetical protein
VLLSQASEEVAGGEGVYRRDFYKNEGRTEPFLSDISQSSHLLGEGQAQTVPYPGNH